jgi:hypothetical protein
MRESARVREGEFISQLRALLESRVSGVDADAKALILLAAAERLRRGESGPECRLVPFVPGRRPTDEASHPTLGSSDQAALILGTPTPDGGENTAYLLLDVSPTDPECGLGVTLWFTGPDGSLECAPIPTWDRRPLPWMTLEEGDAGAATLRATAPRDSEQRLVIALSPAHDLLPGPGWRWQDVDGQLRDGATDERSPYSFGHLFCQQVRVGVEMTRAGVAVAADEAILFACDARKLGSLYRRLIDRLIAPDCARQAKAAGVSDPGPTFHPWYPVLKIGSHKAELYTRALIGDIVDKRRNLTDPGWLLRVGLHLEFLTFLGIVEAVKDEVGDLLTSAERSAFERSPLFGELRHRISPERWEHEWNLRTIAFHGRGAPRAGPVSALNLVRKRRATLAFLDAHHDDLRHAVELAGPNHHNSQETWQRVFRDAERAVLAATPQAFPELGFLPMQVREFVLWHRGGQRVAERRRSPVKIVAWLGDRDGLFASACTQYRQSMNDVAEWAKERLLMDFTGEECIPREVSLLENKIARPARVAMLQRRDGYQEPLELAAPLPEEGVRAVEEIQRHLTEMPTFAPLTAEELQELARTARPITLGPLERLVRQGEQGSSLFVVADGVLEVMVRRQDGQDWPVDTITTGAVIGEMSLLTGEPRAATVRAVDGATVYEIGRRQYEPVLRSRPQLLDDLASIVEQRLRAQSERPSEGDAERRRKAWRERIGAFMSRDGSGAG